jgi:hypothetical protein
MAHSPSLIFNAIAEKTLQQNPFPPAEDFKLLPLILLVLPFFSLGSLKRPPRELVSSGIGGEGSRRRRSCGDRHLFGSGTILALALHVHVLWFS